MTLCDKGFGDDIADTHSWIERTHRVLEHKLETFAEEAQPAFR